MGGFFISRWFVAFKSNSDWNLDHWGQKSKIPEFNLSIIPPTSDENNVVMANNPYPYILKYVAFPSLDSKLTQQSSNESKRHIIERIINFVPI